MNTAPRTHALPFFILLVGLLGLSSHGLAAKVDNLYRASFPVEKQDGAEREQLAAAGLARVLVKVSGRRNLPREGQLGEALQRANRYLQQFSYSGAEQGFILHLDYAKGAVDNLLRKSALPIWPDNRPQILLWLVQDNSQQRQLLAASEDSELQAEVDEAAAKRGLLLELPLMDLDDRQAMLPQAAWALDEESLAAASVRYSSDAALLGRLSLTGSGQWRASWLLLEKSRSRLFDSSGEQRAVVLAEGLHQVADYLSSQHAIVANPLYQQPETMVLDNIADFGGYMQVLKYLNSLAMVRHAEPKQLQGERMQIELQIDGQLQQLIDAMALDRKLVPSAQAGYNGTLYYRLNTGPAPVIEPLPSTPQTEQAMPAGVPPLVLPSSKNRGG